MHLEPNGFLSQRTGLLLRLWEGPLLSKCVIMVFSGAACLTEWPRDPLHLLTAPWWAWGGRSASQLWSLPPAAASRVDDCIHLTLMLRGYRWECVPRVSWETLKMDPSVKRGSPTHLRATGWIVPNVNTSRMLNQFQKMFGQCETVEQRRVYSI